MIAWIDVQQRVPDNRRNVMAWGVGGFFVGGYQPERGRFLGKTKFNPTRDGGRFDLERTSRFTYCKVTHWAEIEGPDARTEPAAV